MIISNLFTCLWQNNSANTLTPLPLQCYWESTRPKSTRHPTPNLNLIRTKLNKVELHIKNKLKINIFKQNLGTWHVELNDQKFCKISCNCLCIMLSHFYFKLTFKIHLILKRFCYYTKYTYIFLIYFLFSLIFMNRKRQKDIH